MNTADEHHSPSHLSPELDEEPTSGPVLRRLARLTYILVVLLVIAGLIFMLFPWRPSPPPPPERPWPIEYASIFLHVMP